MSEHLPSADAGQAPRPDGTLAAKLYAVALLAFPRPLRDEFREEMLAAFAAALAHRQGLGGASARRYARRAWIDAVVAGLRARWWPSGVTRQPPQTPLGRLSTRSQDMFARELGSDLRFALRTLAKSPAFTITALLVLTLGIGINGSIFSAIQATLLSEPPYPEPDRVVMLDLTEVTTVRPGPPRAFPWSYPKYEMMAATADLLAEPNAAYATRTLTLTGAGEPLRLTAEVVTRDYFRVLRVGTAVGRDFAAGGVEPEREVMLGHSLWREAFGSDPDVVGRTLTMNGEPVVVIGVGAAGFRGVSGAADVWIPMESVPLLISGSLLQNFDGHWLNSIGRLRDGATLEELQAQMEAVGTRVFEAFPWDDPTSTIGGSASSLSEVRRNSQAERAVLVVAGAAVLVLLVACANLAALMLARSTERRREVAVRLALGASRARVARGLLAESLLLALGGGVLGLVVARQGIGTLAAWWPSDFNDGSWNVRFVDASSFALDPWTVLYTVGLALLTGLMFGVGPALRLSRSDLGETLKEGSRGARGDGGGFGGRRLLVAAEIAMALVLLVGAGLMISSLGELLAVDQGFDSARLLTFDYALSRSSPAAENSVAFHEQYLDRLRQLPGVLGATAGCVPLGVHCWISGVSRAGDTEYEEGIRPAAGVQIVEHDFFAALGIPLMSGRVFQDTDSADSAPVVVINEAAARKLFGGSSPLGQPFATGVSLTQDDATAEIIGVVGDVLYGAPEEGVMPEAYFSHRQENLGTYASVIVRTAGEPFDLVPSARAVFAELEPDLPIFGITTVEALGESEVSDTRAIMALLSLFAAIALTLAAVGVWGVVAYSVTQRYRELGIRMALGAETGRVVRLVLRQGLGSAIGGILVGLVASLLATRLLANLLYRVSPTDLGAFAAGAGLLLLIAFLAAYLPARRATRVNPVEALRAE